MHKMCWQERYEIEMRSLLAEADEENGLIVKTDNQPYNMAYVGL